MLLKIINFIECNLSLCVHHDYFFDKGLDIAFRDKESEGFEWASLRKFNVRIIPLENDLCFAAVMSYGEGGALEVHAHSNAVEMLQEALLDLLTIYEAFIPENKAKTYDESFSFLSELGKQQI